MTEFISANQVETAATAVRNRAGYQPAIGMMIGSGISAVAEAVDDTDIDTDTEIPHWPVSTVAGHSGRLVIGRMEGQIVSVLQGRAHYYEGYSISQITLPVRVMNALGIRTLVVTNAAGGMNPDFNPGDLMLIQDHLNLLGMTGHNPLRGPNDETVGPRFPDMTEPYDARLRQIAHEAAAEQGFSLREGTYAYVAGPSFETPAELRFLSLIGADAVGMSTVPSVVVARHAGIRVLGISTITNMASPDPAPGTKLTHEEVLAAGKRIIPRLTGLIRGLLRQL
jgi:purine-nucleoside phosphorylase